MLEALTAISWFLRAKSCYDITQARNGYDISQIIANSFVTEDLIYQAKQDIRNENQFFIIGKIA